MRLVGIEGPRFRDVLLDQLALSVIGKILADEATGNLDTRTSFEILVLFQKLHAEGRTIIFVTHNPELSDYSSRNIVLRDGKIISDERNPNPKSAEEVYKSLPVIND